MRSGLVIICLLLLSCAGAGTSATEPASPVAPLSLSLRAGDRFDVLHLERVRLDDREVFIRRTRFALEIRERTPQGSYLVRGTISRERMDDPSISVTTRLRFEWLPDGRIRAYPRAECIDGDSELELARFVRFTLGSAPLATTNGHARTEAWHGEGPIDADVRVSDLDGGRVRLDVSASERIEGADLGALRVDGVVRLRTRFVLDRDTAFVASIRRQIRGSVAVVDRRTSSSSIADLTAELETTVVRAPSHGAKSHPRLDSLDEADPCGPTSHAVQTGVLRGLEPLRAALRACYETALRDSPTLNGRIAVRLSVVSPGHAAMVEVVENALGDDVGRCFAAELSALDASPGPIAGAVVYQFPFVLEASGDAADPPHGVSSP